MTASQTLDEIRADFALLDDWEDRYRYVIEARAHAGADPEAARTEANKVRGCASQVWLETVVSGTGAVGGWRFAATATPIL